jgi:hypothetical protein
MGTSIATMVSVALDQRRALAHRANMIHTGAVLAAVLLSVALSASGSTGCGDRCAASSDSCFWSDERLHGCAEVTTGIYGTVQQMNSGAVGRFASSVDRRCGSETLLITDASGSKTTTTLGSSFAIALEPGTYLACAKDWPSFCARFALTAGERLRFNVSIETSEGGIAHVFSVAGPAGMPCFYPPYGYGAAACVAGLACVPAKTGNEGVCGRAMQVLVDEGDMCDAPVSLTGMRACGPGLYCVASATSGGLTGTCTATSTVGGPCGDGRHICAPAASLHCDAPSHTCANPGAAGAWCVVEVDCDYSGGLGCFDGICSRRPPGEYGEYCGAPDQCRSGVCTNNVCRT